MPVVPFDPDRARPRGQARPPHLPSPAGTAAPASPGGDQPRSDAPPDDGPRRQLPGRTGLSAGERPPSGWRPPAPGSGSVRLSADAAAGVMLPAHVLPPAPRLAINLSPSAATRTLAMLGLGVALTATFATTLALVASTQPQGISAETPAAIAQLTNWLVSVPWLFLAVILAASARIERMVRPEIGPAWATLAFAAAASGAMQVVGRDLVSTFTLVARAGLILVALAALSVAFRQFLSGPSRMVRLRIVGGALGGLVAGLGPFAMMGAVSGLTAAPGFAPLDALLNGVDALLGLVLATFTIHATLVYVRDFLPDFNIALETAPETALAPVR